MTADSLEIHYVDYLPVWETADTVRTRENASYQERHLLCPVEEHNIRHGIFLREDGHI